MLGQVLARSRAAFLWLKVTKLSANGNHAEALERIRFANEKLRKFYYLRTLEVQQLAFHGNDVGALEQAKALIADLAEKTSANERYFLAYARWIGQAAFRRLYSSSEPPSELMLSASAIPTAGVSPTWRRHFVIPLDASGEPIELSPSIASIPREAFARPDVS